MPGRGLTGLQPAWSHAAQTAAARVARALATAEEDSEDSCNSEKFLLEHMHRWSRDRETEDDFPPAPSVEEARFQHRYSANRGGNDMDRQHGAGSSDTERALITPVPEEVPIIRPGQERALQVSSPRFWPPEYDRAGASAASSELLPWLQRFQGRMQLPPPPPGATSDNDDDATDTGEPQPRGFEQAHFNFFAASPPAPGPVAPALPPAMPLDATQRASPRYSPLGFALPAPPSAVAEFSAGRAAEAARWSVTPMEVTAPSPRDAQISDVPPWRHMQHQIHQEEPALIWEETPTVFPWRREEEQLSFASQLNPANANIPRRLNEARPTALTHLAQDEPCPMPNPNPAHRFDRLQIPIQSSVLSPLQIEAEVDSPQHASYQAANTSLAAVHPEYYGARPSRVSFRPEVEEWQVEPEVEAEKSTRLGRSSLNSAKSLESAFSISRLLSPKRKEMLKEKTSFQAKNLPVYHKGEIFTNSWNTRETASMRPPKSRARRLAAHCKSCWESKSTMLPCCTLVLSLLFTSGLAVLLWMADTPDVTEGAFGLASQTERDATINFTYFDKARQHAIASLSVLESGEDGATPQERFAMENTTRAWWRVEVIFFKKDSELLTVQNVEAIRHIERKMMDLPGWKKLCNEKVPPEAKQFCNPGDSFTAVVFGSNQPADPADVAMGALSQVAYDGKSQNMVMPLEQFIGYLKDSQQQVRDFQQVALNRWFALTGTQILKSPMRATFAFYLSQEDVGEWESFAQDELEPLLHEEATKGDGYNSDGTGYEEGEPGIRVFYRADGLKSKEFVRAVAEDAPLRFVACVAVLLGILLTSRRVLLAFSGAVLSLTAPLTASTLAAKWQMATLFLAGKRPNLEYPATTVAAWFLVAVGCCELALATANAWSVKDAAPTLPGCLRRVPGWSSFVYRLLRFILEVPTPTLGPAISLFLCGWVVDMPLVTEFTLHVSLGLASVCVFGLLVFPPACEVGDRLRERSLNSVVMNEMQEAIYGLMPYEFGGEPRFIAKMESLLQSLIDAVSSNTVRILVFLVFLAAAVGASFDETSPLFVSTAPELFHEGHRLRVAPKVRELFGSSELLGRTGAPLETLKIARTCKPDAYDKLSCSWHKCETDGFTEIPEGRCSCFKQTVGSVSDIRKCGAVVRFASLPPGSDAFAKVTFWRWVEDQMGVFIVNNSISAWNMGVLEMESWATGQVTIEPQMVVQTHGADGRAPAWEDACMRMLCYCGPVQCKLEQTWWQYFGQPTIMAPDRRLQIAATLLHDEEEIEVNVVWGLAPTPEIPRKVIKTHYRFHLFQLENPWEQRHVFSICDGLSPRLHVYDRRCWALDFKRWLLSRGERFPVRAANFYSRFQVFVAHYADLHAQQPGGDTYNYFWINRNGSIQGCYATFKAADRDRVGLGKYGDLWQEYLTRRNELRPWGTGEAWQASPQFAAHEAALAVQDGALYTTGLLLICPFALTLILTCSLGLATATLVIEVFALCLLLCIAVGLGIPDFGPMEACGLATFLSILITPLIRTAHQYSLTREGPGCRLEAEFEVPNANLAQFRPRSASITGLSQSSHGSLGPILVLSPRKERHDEEWLVDNSFLQAKTCGLGYRLSPDLKDIDTKSRGYTGLAAWGSTVVGRHHKDDWIKVGERFLPLALNGIPVLVLQPSERSFSPEVSEADDWREEWKSFLFGSNDESVQIWRGAPMYERRKRTLSAVRRMSHTVLGASIAGMIAACGLLPMNMAALGKIGLAVLCAALTVPTAALGLLPMLAMTPPLGPTRVRRRAWLEFHDWLRWKRPHGSEEDQNVGPLTSVTGCASETKSIGELSAEVLGFPFSLTAKSFVEHLPDSLAWMVGYGSPDKHTADRQIVQKLEKSPGRLRSES